MIGEDLRLCLQGNSLGINLPNFTWLKKSSLDLSFQRGNSVEVQTQVLHCRTSVLKEEPSSITYCLLSIGKFQVWECEAMCLWEGSLKIGSLYCQTTGQYYQMSQNMQWGVFSDFHQLQEDQGLPDFS